MHVESDLDITRMSGEDSVEGGGVKTDHKELGYLMAVSERKLKRICYFLL